MDFKRKSLGVTIGAVAAVAMSFAALPASAFNTTGAAYYAADGSSATHSRADRRAARSDRHKDRRHGDRDSKGSKDRDPNVSRDVDRIKTEDGVGRDVTLTNDETGKSVTHKYSTTRDEEAGTVTHSQEVSGPDRTMSSSTTVQKTDDGRTATTTITTPDGDTTTRTVDVSRDPESQSATRTTTTDPANGDARTRETTVQKTDDGFTRTTEFNNGATTNVDASKSSTGEWDREVTRTPGESTTDPDSSSADDSSSED